MTGNLDLPFTARIGRASDLAAVTSTLERARNEEWATRLADKDVTLWSNDAAVQTKIANRLGWLDAPTLFTAQAPALEAFGEKVRSAGFTTAIVAGMGGSSLAPEVLATAFAEISDWLKIRVCDSTDPEAVAAALDGLDPSKTLVIVASKSGTTTETLSFAAYAAAWIRGAIGEGDDPYASMIAISDPSPCIDGIPGNERMLERFLNPADIGGRYSALSFVGLVPASLLGVDLDSLLAAGAVAAAQLREPEPTANRAIALGVIIGALAREGRDKMTLIVDEPIHGFGAWAEQLVAESTGKRGVGVVPVDLEPLGTLESYQDDRLFVRIALRDGRAPRTADGSSVDVRLSELADAGHPVISYTLADPIDLGGEFVHWEAATAIAGAVLGINPFDEPNVTESKQNTATVLGELSATGSLPQLTPTCDDGPLQLWVDDALPAAFSDSAEKLVAGQLQRLAGRGYIGIHAYLAATNKRTDALTSLRLLLRDATRRATTVGYGPRFLHSTGQLHKGGAPIGWFIQLVAERPHDLEIPGSSFTFGQLVDAQALGDARSLVAHELPVLRIHLGSNPDAGLAALESLFRRALSA
ncbi:MAG: glucose-6-phosphate isomerase [Candidatus Limnocylindrus sp.]